MPVNEEAFSVFMLCRNAVLRQQDGKPYDVDVGAVAAAVTAMGYRTDTFVIAVNLMRHLLYEEIV